MHRKKDEQRSGKICNNSDDALLCTDTARCLAHMIQNEDLLVADENLLQ